MEWLFYILIGIGVCLITRSREEGMVCNLAVCLIGAVSGGLLAELSGLSIFGIRESLAIAVMGAISFWAIKEIFQSRYI